MSERLRHLQRQQTLLREHLAWIDGEIARETPAGADAPPLTPPRPAMVAPPTPPAADAPAADADALIERFAAEERQNPSDIRRGCLVIFVIALLLVVGGVAAAWLLFYR